VIRSCAILPRRRDWVGDGATPLMRLPDQPGILPWGTVPAVCALRVYMPTGADADCQRSPPFHGTRPPAALTSAAPTRAAGARLHSTGQGPRQRSPPLRRRGLPATTTSEPDMPATSLSGSAVLQAVCGREHSQEYRPIERPTTAKQLADAEAPLSGRPSLNGSRRAMAAVARFVSPRGACTIHE
jgi:hypothetical protein